MTTVQSQPLHLLVKRNTWEPKHEWESRLLFVEDNLDRHGLEKAIHLSLVWANVTFLGCSYPAHTQELVSDYPRPDHELLRSERKKRERVERKRRLSSGGEVGGGEGARKQARGASHGESSSSSSETAHNTSGDDTDASFEQISHQVDALISAIRKQHEKKAEKEGTRSKEARDGIPKEVQQMLQSMCMCSQCFCPGNSSSSLVNAITQRYIARFDKKFTHDFEFNEMQNGSTECKFFINGELITSGRDESRKTAKQKASEQFVRLVNGYYKENGKPCCPYEPSSRRNK